MEPEPDTEDGLFTNDTQFNKLPNVALGLNFHISNF